MKEHSVTDDKRKKKTWTSNKEQNSANVRSQKHNSRTTNNSAASVPLEIASNTSIFYNF